MRLIVARFVVAIGALAVVAVGLSGPTPAADEKPAVKLAGKWKYQSYRPDPASLAADPANPKFVVWSPPGVGVVTIDPCETKGTLEFTGTQVKVDLEVKVTDGTPATLSITGKMKLPDGKLFTNELQGRFVPAKLGEKVSKDNPLVVRGSIVQTSEDIGPKEKRQPIYTTGFFVIEPLEKGK